MDMALTAVRTEPLPTTIFTVPSLRQAATPDWSFRSFCEPGVFCLPGPNLERRGVSRGSLGAAQDEHRAVFDAIAAGEAEAARQAAQRHLLSAAGRLGVVLPTLRAGGLKQVDKETL
jgi:hypothetical protein